MSEVRVPDIGDFTDVPVIEVFVKAGDTVSVEDPLLTLESDKATMDVPSPAAGVVAQVRVAVGDRVSEGSVLLTIDDVTAEEPAAVGTPRDTRAAPSGRGARRHAHVTPRWS